jgi:hypothetical protein
MRWLRESVRFGLLAGPAGARLGLAQANASGGGSTRPGGETTIGIGLLILAALWVISQVHGGAGSQSQSSNPADTQSKTEPTTTAAPTASPCPIDPTPRPTDRLKDALDQRHLDAARRELLGEVVATKPDGTPVDHVTEVRNAQRKLLRRIAELKNRISYPRCTPEERAAAEEELSEASRLLDNSEQYVPTGI